MSFPNATRTPARDGTAEGFRLLAQTAMFFTANARSNVNVGEFGRSLENIRQDHWWLQSAKITCDLFEEN